VFFLFGLYKGMWRYTGIYDLENLIKACVISSGVIVFILVLKVRFEGFPRSVFVIDLMLTFLFLSGVRVGIRLFLGSGRDMSGFWVFRQERSGQKESIDCRRRGVRPKSS